MLFKSGNLNIVFPAATLRHGACETYHKAAFIRTDCMVFNPANLMLDQKMRLKLDRTRSPKLLESTDFDIGAMSPN
jgi:hypothetical protein